jgi:hypothetical protein
MRSSRNRITGAGKPGTNLAGTDLSDLAYSIQAMGTRAGRGGLGPSSRARRASASANALIGGTGYSGLPGGGINIPPIIISPGVY